MDDVGAFAPVLHHPEQDFGRIPQVGVDDGDGIAAGFGRAGAHRDPMSEIARPRDHPHARTAVQDSAQGSRGGVSASVVDADAFKAGPGTLPGTAAMRRRLGNDGLLAETKQGTTTDGRARPVRGTAVPAVIPAGKG